MKTEDIQAVDSEGVITYSQTTTLAELEEAAVSADTSVASWQAQIDYADKEKADLLASLAKAQARATEAHALVDAAKAKQVATIIKPIAEMI